MALTVDVGVVVSLCLQLRTRAARRAPGSRAIFVLAAFALQRGILQTVIQASELLAVSRSILQVCRHGYRGSCSTLFALEAITFFWRCMLWPREVCRHCLSFLSSTQTRFCNSSILHVVPRHTRDS
jgi:hypothetical protein